MNDHTQRVLITAAAGGIGAAIAERFLRDGAQVAVCDVDEGGLRRLATAHPGLRTTVVDVADAADLVAWVDGAVADLGGVDVLVNNAGIAGPTAYVEDVRLDEWRECLAVCLDSQYLTCRQVVPHLKAQRSGAIVNISSTAGQYGYGQRSPYAAAKWGVIGLTKSLAIELGPFDVRVNAICPGSVNGQRMQGVIARQSELTGVSADKLAADYVQAQSIPRFVEPEEIAAMSWFLASPAAAMVSGQAIAVDGNTETYHLT